ncbi:MAG: choice-of-anchor D domain-containing protein [Thermomicrobiales bacterium]
MSITGVSTTGDFATFANTCVGQTLAPNATCTIGVRFTPTATGQRTGTLVIANTGATTPIVVSLTGNGISAQLSVTPGSLDFGPHQLGTNTVAQTVTVKNIGTGTVTITATALAGSDPTNFEITGNSCQPSGNDVTLAAGQECTISVRFHPGRPGRWQPLGAPEHHQQRADRQQRDERRPVGHRHHGGGLRHAG